MPIGAAAAEPVWNIVAAAFGLLLGFMVVNLWADLRHAQDVVQEEANDLVGLAQLSRGLPEPVRLPLRRQLAAYAELVLDEEWEALGHNRSSAAAGAALETIWRTYMELEPSLGATNASYRASLELLHEVQADRNTRLDAARDEVPGPLWAVMLLGVALMIALGWFTFSERLGTSLLLTVSLCVSLAAILFIIRALNNPYRGDVRADPAPFREALPFLRPP